MSNAGTETWLKWFRDEYGDHTTGIAVDEKDDMNYSRNMILCGIADGLERIATVLENKN